MEVSGSPHSRDDAMIFNDCSRLLTIKSMINHITLKSSVNISKKSKHELQRCQHRKPSVLTLKTNSIIQDGD